MEDNGAYIVMKNTGKLSSKEFDEMKVKADTTEEAEKLVIEEHVGQVRTLKLDESGEKDLIERIMTVLDKEKDEGEKQSDYETRIISEMKNLFQNKV